MWVVLVAASLAVQRAALVASLVVASCIRVPASSGHRIREAQLHL